MTSLDQNKMARLRDCAVAAVDEYKLNLPLRHIIELGNQPLGRRSWKLTTHEMDVFAIPMDQIHALLIAYAAFGNYIGKRYPDHIPQDEFRGLLVWLRHHRHGPVDAIALTKADVSEFCWLAETVFALCPELALRYFQKRELNLASVQGLVS